jgi:hypothetical protein
MLVEQLLTNKTTDWTSTLVEQETNWFLMVLLE